MKRFIAFLAALAAVCSITTAGCAADAQPQLSDPAPDPSSELSGATAITAKDNGEYTIRSAGTYVLSGEANNFTLVVEAEKEDKVQLVLNGAAITNQDFPVIYVKSVDKCVVTAQGENSLAVSGPFVPDGDTNTDAVIFSKTDLTLKGTGSLTIRSDAGNGISCKDDLKINGGSYRITSAKHAVEANDSIAIDQGEFIIQTERDAFHCKNDDLEGSIVIRDGSFTITAKDDGIQATTTLVVEGGEFSITAAEGMEATSVQINGGVIRITASDDGINAARKSPDCDPAIEINGGEITVAAGPGDTDCLDSNGTITVNGGTLDLSGSSTFDADRGSVYNGGTIIINGTAVNSIPEQMMGGRGDRGGFGGQDSFGGPGGN
ncbi:MAG: carbohydrate-binding domain-containing protein, partial [Oscillospiraceae bacterium]|nr:carbohydrate-binding domain-containing protein [Oscillospiraceae bacterium]